MAFASLFDEMTIHRYDADGKSVGEVKVPLKLAYKEKVISSLLQQNVEKPYTERYNENVLPMISVAWKGLAFDAERARGLREKRKIYVEYVTNPNDPNGVSEMQHLDMQTVPYKLSFQVTLWAKYMDDLVQLIENIDPFMHPEIFIGLPEKSVGIERKIKIVKTGESNQFNTDIADNELRSKILMYNMDFEMECNFYKPELPLGKPIKSIFNRFSMFDQNGKSGVSLGDVTVQQTTSPNYSAATPGSSACNFNDLNSELVGFIRNYSDPESILQIQYGELNSCTSPSMLQEPTVTPIPTFVTGNTIVTALNNQVDIMSDTLLFDYVPVATIGSPNISGSTISVSSITNITPGKFTVNLSETPTIDGYTIVWYAYQKGV